MSTVEDRSTESVAVWPEDLPRDSSALAKEMEDMQRAFSHRRRNGEELAVPDAVHAVEQEVRVLMFASGPFPQEIAPDLAKDMQTLRSFYHGN